MYVSLGATSLHGRLLPFDPGRFSLLPSPLPNLPSSFSYSFIGVVFSCCAGGRTMYKESCPTFTCGNKFLFVMLADPEEQRYFRFLIAPERYSMQGKPPEMCRWLGNVQLAFKASGNAYPVPLIIASLFPLLETLGPGGLLIEPKLQGTFEDSLSTVRRILKRKKLVKRPASHAGGSRKLIRRRSSQDRL